MIFLITRQSLNKTHSNKYRNNRQWMDHVQLLIKLLHDISDKRQSLNKTHSGKYRNNRQWIGTRSTYNNKL